MKMIELILKCFLKICKYLNIYVYIVQGLKKNLQFNFFFCVKLYYVTREWKGGRVSVKKWSEKEKERRRGGREVRCKRMGMEGSEIGGERGRRE